MICSKCNTEMTLIESYVDPDECYGYKTYSCPNHPNLLERSAWCRPHIPLERILISFDAAKDLDTFKEK